MPDNTKKRKRLDKEESRIVIVGAGLAGISAALSLEQAGFSRIDVLERDASFEQQKEGYGLTLNYNPKGPLAKLGVLEEVAQQDCPSRSHYLFRPDGSIMGYFGNAFRKTRGHGQRGNLRVPRKVLRKLLLDKLQHSTVHWGYRLIDYTFDSTTSKYSVQFEAMNETSAFVTIEADLLVAADGIRSATLAKLYRPLPNAGLPSEAVNNTVKPAMDPSEMGLRYMGVRLILGISNFTHPLLKERGFYTLDGKHRLFTMPYSSDRYDKDKTNRIMWQLSFSTDDGPVGPLDTVSLRDYVAKTCKTWHDPVLRMVEATPNEAIWGTDLMDRDPRALHSLFQDRGMRRLVVIGDALHSMSPFKGAGANQALTDGPLLAKWLEKASIDSAVNGFWRETVDRTAPVVAASRMAAKELHSPSVMTNSHGFAGAKSDGIQAFLETLQERGIGANSGPTLDQDVDRLLAEYDMHAPEVELPVLTTEQEKALEFCRTGNTEGLRRQSLAKQSESIRTARDATSLQSCLHLAAEAGHFETCKWLLFELGCDSKAADGLGKIPYDVATDPRIRALLDLAAPPTSQ